MPSSCNKISKTLFFVINFVASTRLPQLTTSQFVFLAIKTASSPTNVGFDDLVTSVGTFNEALYDLEIYSGSNNSPFTIRLLEGKVKLSKQVTT